MWFRAKICFEKCNRTARRFAPRAWTRKKKKQNRVADEEAALTIALAQRNYPGSNDYYISEIVSGEPGTVIELGGIY